MKDRIIAAVEELFFAAKIRAAAELAGVEVVFPRTLEAFVESAAASAPKLLIVDLHLQRYDPFALARRLKADSELQHLPLTGFFSHVQTELQRRAEDAGFDRVMPRSAFSKRLPEIVRGRF